MRGQSCDRPLPVDVTGFGNEIAAVVSPVQRLVENENVRIVNQCGGQPHSLSHSPRVGTHGPVGSIGKIDQCNRAFGRGVKVGHPSYVPHHSHKITPRHEGVGRLMFRHDATDHLPKGNL